MPRHRTSIFFNLLIFSTILISSLSSCKPKAEEQTASSMTYREFYDLIFEDFNNRIEWHRDDFDREAESFISVSSKEECEGENCGKKVFVKNNHPSDSVRVVMQTSYSIPNTLPYIANQFKLAPGEEVYLACEKLCFKNSTYDLDHKVVVASYKDKKD